MTSIKVLRLFMSVSVITDGLRKGSKAQLKYSTGILRDRVGDSPRWQSVWYLTLNKCQRAVQSPASLSLSSSFYAYSLCRTGDDGFISPPLTTTRWHSFRCHIGCVWMKWWLCRAVIQWMKGHFVLGLCHTTTPYLPSHS